MSKSNRLLSSPYAQVSLQKDILEWQRPMAFTASRVCLVKVKRIKVSHCHTLLKMQYSFAAFRDCGSTLVYNRVADAKDHYLYRQR